MTSLTKAEQGALKWLSDKNGVLLAAGESAPVMRSTWNHLSASGHVQFYWSGDKGRGRLRITDLGRKAAAK